MKTNKPIRKMNVGNKGSRGSKKKVRMPRVKRMTPFTLALKDPFHPNSMGCQVPDPYPFPTATYHSHTTTVIGNSVYTDQTRGAIAILPNPVISLMDFAYLNNMASFKEVVSSTPYAKLGSTLGKAGYGLYGATSIGDLNSKYANFRVVSWGVKLSCLIPELTATGRVICAFVPLEDTIPNTAQLVAADQATSIDGILGIPHNVVNTSQLLNLPGAFEVTVGDLLRGDLQFSGMYTNTNFWTFKATGNSVTNASNQYSGDTFNWTSSTGSLSAVGYQDVTRCVGGTALVIYFEGIPPETTSAFNVEIIYHLEGTPQISDQSSPVLVTSSMPLAAHGSTSQVESSLSEVSTVEKAVQFVTKGANFLNRNQDQILGAARSISSILHLLRG